MRALTAVAVASLAAALLAACSRPSLQLEEQQTFRAATRSQTVEAPVSDQVERLELQLSLELNRGSLAFRVTDPQGVVVWQGTLSSGGELSDRRVFENPAQGTWRFDIDLAEASGNYRVEWVGR
ncbi:MAG TPA: hypothetical protein VHQ65_09075 [Thermoanaerobaculia bacterium]|nr:hypothetical protein [Thermoanaerobaculia bacterium]